MHRISRTVSYTHLDVYKRQEHVSPDDFVFIEKISSLKAIIPDVLVELISAIDAVGRSRIEILPLELATVRVCTK